MSAPERPPASLVRPLTVNSFWICAQLSFTGFVVTFMTNKSIELSKLGRITLLIYVQLPLVVLLSWLAFGDVMSIWSGIGCLVIVGSAIAITISKEEQPQPPLTSHGDSERDTAHDGGAYSLVGQVEEEHEMEKPIERRAGKGPQSPA